MTHGLILARTIMKVGPTVLRDRRQLGAAQRAFAIVLSAAPAMPRTDEVRGRTAWRSPS